MVAKKTGLIFLLVVLSTTLARAEIESVEYQFVVGENGNVAVGISLYGDGNATLIIPEDSAEIKVEGADYTINGGLLELSILHEKAVIFYKTSLMTQKIGNGWTFSSSVSGEKNIVRLAMPANTVITETLPNGEISSDEFLKLKWNDVSEIKVNYSFPNSLEENKRSLIFNLLVIISAVIIVFLIVLAFLRKNKISGRKEQILQTLGENENKIVRILIEMKGSAKRSILEKKIGIAKSSLAAAINNLERKKILEVDREFSKHLVKLEKWFMKL